MLGPPTQTRSWKSTEGRAVLLPRAVGANYTFMHLQVYLQRSRRLGRSDEIPSKGTKTQSMRNTRTKSHIT